MISGPQTGKSLRDTRKTAVGPPPCSIPSKPGQTGNFHVEWAPVGAADFLNEAQAVGDLW